jgi:hypothetical protein
MHRQGLFIRQWQFAGRGCFHFGAVLLCSLALTSCVSKSKAEAQARAAFLAGQQQGTMMNRQKQLQGPTVTVLGEVRNALVTWTADLTLAKAVVAAQYYGRTDPARITIQREGKEIHCDPRDLLGGKDVQLEPNDVIELAH